LHKKIFFTVLLSIMLVLVGCSSDDNNNNINDSNDNNNTEVNENNNNDNNNEDNNNNNVNNDNDVNNNNNNEYNNNDDEASEGERGHVQFEGLEIKIPAETVELDLGDQPLPMVGYLFDEMSGANFNVVADSLPEDLELSSVEYLELSIEGAEEDGISYSENRTFEHNDLEWHEYIGEVDDVKLIQRNIFHNHVLYVFSYSAATDDELEEFMPLFDEVTESVELID